MEIGSRGQLLSVQGAMRYPRVVTTLALGWYGTCYPVDVVGGRWFRNRKRKEKWIVIGYKRVH